MDKMQHHRSGMVLDFLGKRIGQSSAMVVDFKLRHYLTSLMVFMNGQMLEVAEYRFCPRHVGLQYSAAENLRHAQCLLRPR